MLVMSQSGPFLGNELMDENTIKTAVVRTRRLGSMRGNEMAKLAALWTASFLGNPLWSRDQTNNWRMMYRGGCGCTEPRDGESLSSVLR